MWTVDFRIAFLNKIVKYISISFPRRIKYEVKKSLRNSCIILSNFKQNIIIANTRAREEQNLQILT